MVVEVINMIDISLAQLIERKKARTQIKIIISELEIYCQQQRNSQFLGNTIRNVYSSKLENLKKKIK